MNNRINMPLLAALLLFSGGVRAQGYSLSRCEEMALENNYRVKNSQLEVEAAEQTRKQAFTNYFPSVQGVGAYFDANQGLVKTDVDLQNYLTPELAAMIPAQMLGALPSSVPVSLMKSGTVAGVTATQPVFAGGRIVNGNKLARLGEDVSKMRLELTEKEVVAQTHSYFWQVVNLEEKLRTISTVENLLGSLHKDVSAAVRAGLTTRNDLLRVELQMQEVAADRLKVENGLEVTKMALAQFVGAAPEGFAIEYDGPGEYRSPEAYHVAAQDAVYGRTESKLLDKSVTASRLQTKVSFGEHLPSVAVGGGYLYNDLAGPSNNAGVVYATVSIPISGWWGGSHAHKKHKVAELQAENDRQNAIELMTVETNRTWNELVEAYRRILLAQQSIDSSTENLRIVTNSYKAGTVPLTDVLDAQLLFQQSRDAHTDACGIYQVKLLKYRQITVH